MIADAAQKSEALITDAQTRSETQLRQAKEKADALQADAEKSTEIMATIPAAFRARGRRAAQDVRARIPCAPEVVPGVAARGLEQRGSAVRWTAVRLVRQGGSQSYSSPRQG